MKQFYVPEIMMITVTKFRPILHMPSAKIHFPMVFQVYYTPAYFLLRFAIKETKSIPNNTTEHTTSAEAKKLHLNEKPGNSTINKISICKSTPIWNKKHEHDH
jgi:hypothetical protein